MKHGAALALVALAACRYEPTEVLVLLDTDAPTDRAMTVEVRVVSGVAQPAGDPSHAWDRAPDGGLSLPASFAVVPPPEGARDGVVTLSIEARIAPGSGGEPTVVLRRLARFSFVPRTTLALPVFLAMQCDSPAEGCTTPGAPCTVASRCEEQGLTCANDARCASVDVVPSPSHPDASPAFDHATTPLPDPPRALSPASSAALTAGGVVFAWEPAPGADGARVELCADRACATVERTVDADGAHTDPVADLRAGTHFFRLRSRTGGAFGAPGPVWQFVAHPGAPSRAAFAYPVLDVDGDGLADTAIGAPAGSSVRIYRGRAGAFLPASEDATLTAGGAASQFGASIAAAGDVDGDGFADLVVGAPGTGHAYVFRGGPSGLGATPWATLPGPGESVAAQFGGEVAGAGDVDGDGYGDVLVGAAFHGAVWFYRGGPAGIRTPAAAVIASPSGQASFGTAVATAGDVDGDGFADAVVGEFGYGGSTGRAYVFRGGASGLATTASATLDGTVASGQFGYAAAGTGDVDGDGLADVAVGAWAAQTVSVYPGASGGVASGRVVVVHAPVAGAATRFGVSVAPAGDFDGDGAGDLLVGAQDLALAYVFRGGSAVATTPFAALQGQPGPDSSGLGATVAGGGDFDGDGRADAVAGTTSANTAFAFRGVGAAPANVASARAWSGPASFGTVIAR